MTIDFAARSDWAGRAGDVWRENQVQLDRMLAPLGIEALKEARPAPGDEVLEIGCGAGAMTIEILSRVGDRGRVVAVDLSPQLLSRARERIAVSKSVEFILGDAARAIPANSRFDLAFSRFGVMFFENPVAAFARFRNALKRGGRLVFVCWRGFHENAWATLPYETVRGLVPALEPPADGVTGPFAFGDADKVRSLLESAGFSDVSIRSFDAPLVYGESAGQLSDDAERDQSDHHGMNEAVGQALELTLRVGPIARAIAEQPMEIRRLASERLRKLFAERVTRVCGGMAAPDSDMVDAEKWRVTLGGAVWIVSARNLQLENMARSGV